MKIWITKEKECHGGETEIHFIKPLYRHPEEYACIFSEGDSINEKAFKAILNLDDWPNHEEVLEYDTVKEEGLIFHGREL